MKKLQWNITIKKKKSDSFCNQRTHRNFLNCCKITWNYWLKQRRKVGWVISFVASEFSFALERLSSNFFPKIPKAVYIYIWRAPCKYGLYPKYLKSEKRKNVNPKTWRYVVIFFIYISHGGYTEQLRGKISILFR